MRVAGSRVLITGAGQGLGFAIASEFVRAGAQVILTDVNVERLAQAQDRLGRAPAFHLDVTAPDQVEATP